MQLTPTRPPAVARAYRVDTEGIAALVARVALVVADIASADADGAAAAGESNAAVPAAAAVDAAAPAAVAVDAAAPAAAAVDAAATGAGAWRSTGQPTQKTTKSPRGPSLGYEVPRLWERQVAQGDWLQAEVSVGNNNSRGQ